jgi:hypothetical protein
LFPSEQVRIIHHEFEILGTSKVVDMGFFTDLKSDFVPKEFSNYLKSFFGLKIPALFSRANSPS